MNKVLKIAIVVVLCLIVILTITLFACQNDDDKKTTTTTTTTTTTNNGDPECTDHVDADTNYVCDNCGEELEKPACTEHTDADGDKACDNCGEPMPDIDHGNYTETNDKVYVISNGLHIRSTPEILDNNAIGWVEQDTELERLGYYASGWSKISFEGEVCYVSTDCLTTSKPITSFTEVNETVYFIHSALAFTKPSHIEDYSVADFTFEIGESVTRTGVATVVYVAEDGKEYTFARIEFKITVDGEEETAVRYVNNNYLSTEDPSDYNPDGSVVFEDNSDVLVVKEGKTVNVRKSTAYDEEGSPDEIAHIISEGTELQAVGKGTEEDGTVWYKVEYEDGIYYVIYNEANFDIAE